MRFVPEKQEEEKPRGFDLVVHHRDNKTGLVTKEDSYILRTIAMGTTGDKSRVWERPKGSGNLWDRDNNPIGRWDKTKPEGERFLKGEAHVKWEAPETNDQKLARAMGEQQLKIAELERKLIEMEQAKKDAPVQTQKKTQGA